MTIAREIDSRAISYPAGIFETTDCGAGIRSYPLRPYRHNDESRGISASAAVPTTSISGRGISVSTATHNAERYSPLCDTANTMTATTAAANNNPIILLIMLWLLFVCRMRSGGISARSQLA